MERLSQIATRSLLACFALFVAVVAAFTLYGLRYSDRAYIGTQLPGSDLSGMTRSEVERQVSQIYAGFGDTSVTLLAEGQQYERTASALGVRVDQDATVDLVMDSNRSGSPWERSIVWVRGLIWGTELSPVLIVDAAKFQIELATIAPDVVFAPSDARVDVGTTGTAVLVDDVAGQSLDVSATLVRVVQGLSYPGDATVSLALVEIPPAIIAADIAGGMPSLERALESKFTITADTGEWGLTRADLGNLLWVDTQGDVQVRSDVAAAFVANIAAQANRPSRDAEITVDDNGQFVVVPDIVGVAVDQKASTDRLIAALQDGKATTTLVVQKTTPSILTTDAETWAAAADTLVGDGLTLVWTGGSSHLGRADLIAALVITPQPSAGDAFALAFDPDILADRMTPLQEDLTIPAQEAQFRLVDGAIRFQAEARSGRSMDMDASVRSVIQAIGNGDPEAPIAVAVVEPTYTSASRADIALPDVLGVSETYYGNSSEPRRHNVERAVELQDGWLIPPGGIFSFAQFSGLITEQNGFVTGFGIVADPDGGVTTAPVIGGGICQVSTTIFQAAFWAGLKVVERWAHPYWIESYGQPPYGMRGLDAMVNIEPDWSLDLKLENTTGNWIAVVMTADGQNVHAEILGTNPGWEIDAPEPVLTDIVTPETEMRYTDSPELPKGQELQVEHAREGFTSTITRTVRTTEGKIVDEYILESTYAASRNLTLRGTGDSGSGD